MTRRNTTSSDIGQAAQVRHRLFAGLTALALLASVGLAVAYPGIVLATTTIPIDGGLSASGTQSPQWVEPAFSSESTVSVDTSAAPGSTDASGSAETTVTSDPIGVVVTVSPDETRSIAPGDEISYTFAVTNETTSSGSFELTTTGTAGFDTRVSSLEGSSVASATLAAGETTLVVATISVPETASVGTIDVSTLAATLDSSPSVTASASAATEVLDGLTVTPDNTGTASAGTDITYRHSIVNSWPTTRTISLSSVGSQHWPVVFYAPDGVTVITSVTVGPFGGRQDALARVSVSEYADSSMVDTVTITAMTESATVSATDTTHVHVLDTYSDSLCTTLSSDFRLTDVVYARGDGLNPSSTVGFVWKDASGQVARRSSALAVDASGTVSDAYSSIASDTVGTWTVELHENDADGKLIEARTFGMTFKGEIFALSATDGRNTDATIAVSSAIQNETSQEITASALTYLVWWDDDDDGEFGLGDTFVDASGTAQPYSEVATTHVTAIVSVPASSASAPASGTWTESQPWTMSNHQFPNLGTYNVTAVWQSSTGATIDKKTAQFFSVPTLGWPPLLLLVGTLGVVIWRQGRHVLPGPAAKRWAWPALPSRSSAAERNA